MSDEKRTDITIETGGGSVTIGGNANVGSIVETTVVRGELPPEHVAALDPVEPFDVFISYARADRSAAEFIAEVLERAGFTVWYDRELAAGDQFVQHINARLAAARYVLVLWSSASVNSEWVLNEAEMGRRRNVLIAVCLDDVAPPAPFTLLHSPRLLVIGDAADPGLVQVLTRLALPAS